MRTESLDKIKRNKDQGNNLVRYIKSFIHACNGISYYLKTEHNIIIIVLAIIVVTIAGFNLNISSNEWLFCITMFGCVMAFELVNTAIEATLDLCYPKIHPLAKIAKDAASAAVFILALTSIVGAIIIFLPKFNM